MEQLYCWVAQLQGEYLASGMLSLQAALPKPNSCCYCDRKCFFKRQEAYSGLKVTPLGEFGGKDKGFLFSR